MGHKQDKYSQTLHQQVYERLTSMLKSGEGRNKHGDAKLGNTDDKIYSYNTYKTYIKHCDYFIKWIKANHNTTSLKKAKKYVGEYLQSRVDKGLSAYTIRTEAAALNKLYGIKPTDKDYFEPPQRSRADIKRSRLNVKRDRNFSANNNQELIRFAQGTGLRRSELEKLKGKDYISRERLEKEYDKLMSQENRTPRDTARRELIEDALAFKDKQHYLYVKGKGGRERISPITSKYAEQIVERCKSTPKDKRVWEYVNTNADIHSYRSDYATALYKEYARDIKDIPYDRIHAGTGHQYQSDVYTCRGDEAGKKLDKRAMLLSSKALGHNRIEVIARHYLRGI